MERKTKSIQFNGRNLVVYEITVAQIVEWEESITGGDDVTIHLLDKIMNKSLPVSGLRLCAPELTSDDLQIAPSEIEQVYDAVEEVNPFFIKHVENMAHLGAELLAVKLDNPLE